MISKTHCKRGHVLDDESIYVSPKGHLVCRVCRRLNESNRVRGPRNKEYVLARRPSPEMLADAERRANATRDLTAMLMGDPPRGCSALDRREGTC